jgi:flagellar hook-associated protein 3 FlgL
MMRVTDAMMYSSSTDSMLNLQSSIAKLTQETSQGTVLTPSDDPVAAARALDLEQSQALNTQLETNRSNATSLLQQTAGTISDVIGVLSDAKSQIIGAGNATYTDQDRSNSADTLKTSLQQLLTDANATDGLGNYLFSGYKSSTQPFTQDTSGAVMYNGDQGIQTLQVDTTNTMAVSVSGQAMFQGQGADVFNMLNNIITTLKTPVSAAANATEAANSKVVYDAAYGKAITGLPTPTQADIDAANATATPDQIAAATTVASNAQAAHDTDYTRTDFTPGSTGAMNQALSQAQSVIDKAMNNATTAQSTVGSNEAELTALNAVGSTQDVQYTSQIADLMGQGPDDFAKTVSALSQQQTYLLAAQKSFATISGLSLLNFLK